MLTDLPKKPDAIILDMDGVLADTEPIHVAAFRMLLKEYGIDADDDYLNSFIGHSIENNVITINATYFKSSPKPVAETARYRDDIYYSLLESTNLRPLPGVQDLLLYCSQNEIALALASSSIREQVDLILAKLTKHANGRLVYDSVFSVIVCGDDVSAKKPAKDIYQLTLQKLNRLPAKCFAIEDSAAGIQSAQSAGLKCVYLENIYSLDSQVSIADYQIKSLFEIISFLEQ